MVGHGRSSAGSYLADPTSPIPSHCASIAVTSTLRVNYFVCLLVGAGIICVNCSALHLSQLGSLLSKGHLEMFQTVFSPRSTGLCARVC